LPPGVGRIVIDDPRSEIHLARHTRVGIGLPVWVIFHVAGPAAKRLGGVLELVVDPAGDRDFRRAGIEVTARSIRSKV